MDTPTEVSQLIAIKDGWPKLFPRRQIGNLSVAFGGAHS
jgi:hypothetical protein